MSLCCDGVRQEGTRRAGFSDRRDAVQTPSCLKFFRPRSFPRASLPLQRSATRRCCLPFFLAARFRKPWTIILGIFVATFLNHVIAGALGATLANFISADLLRWILIVSFIAMGIWILIPDKIDEGGNDDRLRRFGVFGTTVILFFIAEVGDKTQVATVALAARYPAEAFWVVCGTTLGLMIADAPAVFIGNKLAEKISMKLMRQVAAAVFFILAVVAYLEA